MVSGQYVAGDDSCGGGSPHDPLVEIEISGVPIDCCKRKTAPIKKYSLNPIWNENFSFKVWKLNNSYFLILYISFITCIF